MKIFQLEREKELECNFLTLVSCDTWRVFAAGFFSSLKIYKALSKVMKLLHTIPPATISPGRNLYFLFLFLALAW